MPKTHDLTHGWTLTIFETGAMAISCVDPTVGGIALDPDQAHRLRELVLDQEQADAEDQRDAEIAERERGLDQILDHRDQYGI